MKKSLIIGLVTMAGAIGAFAQGQINFANYYSSTQLTGVYWGNGPDAGAYVGSDQGAVVTLLYGASTATSISELTGSFVTGIQFGGAYSGNGPGQASVGNEGQFLKYLVPTSAGLAGGQTYAFAYEVTAVLQGVTYTGVSSIWTQTTTASSTATPTAYIDNNSLAIVAPVPEPSTLALAGLGGFGMFMAFRRKKA
jgi:hypothetical protein